MQLNLAWGFIDSQMQVLKETRATKNAAKCHFFSLGGKGGFLPQNSMFRSFF